MRAGARPHRRDRARADQRQGHHLRAARLHRPRRGHRRARHRHAGAAVTRFVATFGYVGFLPGAGRHLGLAGGAADSATCCTCSGGPLAPRGRHRRRLRRSGTGRPGSRPSSRRTSTPSHIVIDEVVGQWIALMPLSAGLWFAGAPPQLFPWPGWVVGFLLFRLFDIWKPGPVGWADRRKGPTGVMLDDVVAGAARRARRDAARRRRARVAAGDRRGEGPRADRGGARPRLQDRHRRELHRRAGQRRDHRHRRRPRTSSTAASSPTPTRPRWRCSACRRCS